MLIVSLIPGFMVGVEWPYEHGFFIIDLGIIRITIDYWGDEGPEEGML